MGSTRFLLLVFCAALSLNCASCSCNIYRKGPQNGDLRVLTDKLPADKKSITINLNPKHVIGTYVSGVKVKACSEILDTANLHIAYEHGEVTVTKDSIFGPTKAYIDITVDAYLSPVIPPFKPPPLTDGPLELVEV